MAKAAQFVKALSKVARSFTIEIGPIKASGAPAVIVAITGAVVGTGIAVAIARSASRLPETFDSAKGLADSLRPKPRHLNP